MAITTLISFGIQGAAGPLKRFPVWMDSGAAIADIQDAIDTLAPAIDAAIAGKITDVEVTMAFSLPGGLKASPDAGSHSRQGANLTFDAESTNYAHTVYLPTWEEAGFSGDTVLETGVYDTLQDALIASYGTGEENLTDKYGNDLVSFVSGERTFRK